VIRELTAGLRAFLDRNAHVGWTSVDDFRGLRRDRIVSHSQIRRPGDKDYHGGYEAEGYAPPPGAAAASTSR
jgi:dihydropyrimidine dehydrogenase (NAD+) subunit PreA